LALDALLQLAPRTRCFATSAIGPITSETEIDGARPIVGGATAFL
jgi:hypothetical protein